ncbi:MAG TPA: hypothetical protein VJP79_00605 [Nitrososphaera sp.]|nr:hypothetical protein [Nitrososphaera sp.]
MLQVKKSYLVIGILVIVALTTVMGIVLIFNSSNSATSTPPAFVSGKLVAIRAWTGSEAYENASLRTQYVSIPRPVATENNNNTELGQVLNEADSLYEIRSKYPAGFISKPSGLASIELNEEQTTRLLSSLPVQGEADTEKQGDTLAINHYFRIESGGILYEVGILTITHQ